MDPNELSLSDWLSRVVHRKNRSVYTIDYSFPTDALADEYLGIIQTRPEAEVRAILRGFLMPSGALGQDSRLIQDWAANPDRFREAFKSTEFAKRVVDKRRPNWEGNTWVLDLLPDYPQLAIDAIDAYFTAHIIFLPDGRFAGLDDAMRIIRARYFDYKHPQTILSNLRPRDFEFLIYALYKGMGYSVFMTKATRDGGFDMRAVNEAPGRLENTLVECKLYEGTVGVLAVRSLNGAVRDDHNANKGTLVCSSQASREAKKFAGNNGIEIIEWPALNRLLNQNLGANWSVRIDGIIAGAKRETLQSKVAGKDENHVPT